MDAGDSTKHARTDKIERPRRVQVIQGTVEVTDSHDRTRSEGWAIDVESNTDRSFHLVSDRMWPIGSVII